MNILITEQQYRRIIKEQEERVLRMRDIEFIELVLDYCAGYGSFLNRKYDAIFVNGFVDFKKDDLISLPDNMTVDGSLDVRRTKIKKLPNNLKVNGTLFASHMNITSLPENLYVNENLYLLHCEIEKLPNG